MRPSVAVTFVSAPRSQHSCFAALAKNSHLRTVFTALRAAASRQCDCHVARCAPRNDKAVRVYARFIMLIFIKCRTRVYSLSFRGSETTVGISRKRNESSGGGEPPRGAEPARAGWLAQVRGRHFPSGRLPRFGCAFARNDSGEIPFRLG